MQIRPRHKTTNHVLGKGNARVAEELLVSLANVPDWPLIGERSQFQRHIDSVERMRKLYPEAYKYCSTIDMLALRELLRKVWTSPDLRSKEWHVCALRHLHAEIVRAAQALRGDGEKKLVNGWQNKKMLLDSILGKPETAAGAIYAMMRTERADAALKNSPPSHSFFDDCCFHLQRNLHRACVCRRNKDCNVMRYFFINRKNQKFCSQECASSSRRASNLKSWHKHKDQWKPKRKKRRK